MKNRRTIIYLLIILSLVLLLLALVIMYPRVFKRETKLEVAFLDIGQGDAALIQLPDKERVLIDGGADNLVLHRLGEELLFYERRLDYLVVSHFHEDHVVGLIEIMRRYQVGAVVFGAGLEKGLLGEILLLEAKQLGVDIIIIEGEGKISFSVPTSSSKCTLHFLNPLILEIKSDGNNSLLAKLDCAGLKFLFAGDNEAEVERALYLSNYDLRADVFKASHHGSKTSNSREFLTAIAPEIMVISAGKENRFNHPALETLETATSLGIDIRRTDQVGALRFQVNLANIK